MAQESKRKQRPFKEDHRKSNAGLHATPRQQREFDKSYGKLLDAHNAFSRMQRHKLSREVHNALGEVVRLTNQAVELCCMEPLEE